MFCFRLSFFPRGGGPGDRAGQPGRVGVGPGNRAGWIASGRAGQPSLQLAVRTGEPTCGSTGTPTGGSIGGSIVPTADAKFGPSTGPSTALQPTQSLVLLTGGSIVPTAEAKVGPSNRWFNRPSNRRKVRSFNRSFNSPPTDAKFGPSTAPSTDAPDSHANAPQPKSQTMQRDSGRTASAILKIYVKLHIFIRKAKLSST